MLEQRAGAVFAWDAWRNQDPDFHDILNGASHTKRMTFAVYVTYSCIIVHTTDKTSGKGLGVKKAGCQWSKKLPPSLKNSRSRTKQHDVGKARGNYWDRPTKCQRAIKSTKAEADYKLIQSAVGIGEGWSKEAVDKLHGEGTWLG